MKLWLYKRMLYWLMARQPERILEIAAQWRLRDAAQRTSSKELVMLVKLLDGEKVSLSKVNDEYPHLIDLVAPVFQQRAKKRMLDMTPLSQRAEAPEMPTSIAEAEQVLISQLVAISPLAMMKPVVAASIAWRAWSYQDEPAGMERALITALDAVETTERSPYSIVPVISSVCAALLREAVDETDLTVEYVRSQLSDSVAELL